MWLGIRRERVFVGKEKLHEVGMDMLVRRRGWVMEKALWKCPGKALMKAVESSCGGRSGSK